MIGLATACRTTPEVPPVLDRGSVWQLHDDFLFDRKIQLNSYADNDRILLAGSRVMAMAPGDERPKTDTTFTFYAGQAQLNGRTDYRPLLSSAYVAIVNNNVVRLLPTRHLLNDRASVYLNVMELDKEFSDFNLMPAAAGEAMLTNTRQQLLVPYWRRGTAAELSLALISVRMPTAPDTRLTVDGIKIIRLNGTTTLHGLISINEYFIISTGAGTFRISPDGTVRKTYPDTFGRLFVLRDKLYGIISFDGNVRLAVSADAGSTWSVLSERLPKALAALNYQAVNDQLIATYNSQLFQIVVTATQFNAVELDNTGLYGNQIVSVAAFRNTVYVSTLSGVFTKPLRNFLAPKQDK